MKKAIMAIAILLAAGTTAFAQAKMDSTHMTMKMGAKKYTCPMHPEVVKSQPGKCPKCGMQLVKKEMDKTKYTCTMHPEIVKGKAGKCPKCGMEMVPMKNKKNT